MSKNKENIIKTLEILKKELPACFKHGHKKLPLALGIHKSIIETYVNDENLTPKNIKSAIKFYVNGKTYLQNLIKSKQRIDINGKFVMPVTPAEKSHAEKILALKEKNVFTKINKAKVKI